MILTSVLAEAASTDTPDAAFDFGARVDDLRTHPNEVLRARIAEARREQQRWRLEELAATRVLDDRGALERMPDRTISSRTEKTNVEVARALESRPALAAAAHDGALSWDQLQPLCELSTPETDAEWARRGQGLAPVDLHRKVRIGQTVTLEDAQRRHEARELGRGAIASTGCAAVGGASPTSTVCSWRRCSSSWPSGAGRQRVRPGTRSRIARPTHSST